MQRFFIYFLWYSTFLLRCSRFVFIARRVQWTLFLVDREVGLCVTTAYSLSTIEHNVRKKSQIVWLHLDFNPRPNRREFRGISQHSNISLGYSVGPWNVNDIYCNTRVHLRWVLLWSVVSSIDCRTPTALLRVGPQYRHTLGRKYTERNDEDGETPEGGKNKRYSKRSEKRRKENQSDNGK